MDLLHDRHLAYCTNIHRGESWPEILSGLEKHTLRVRAQVCPDKRYGIGLRLSAHSAQELARPKELSAFQRWLDKHDCYVYTINGFPFGQFHGTRVKEQVYRPDWTSPERLEYTKLLFHILVQLLPEGVDGSVSTVPCSFKSFAHEPEAEERMRSNLRDCLDHLLRLSDTSGHDLHLGLEPEPLCTLETSAEAIEFFGRLWEEYQPHEDDLRHHIGVNYDCCHLAVEFEEAREALNALTEAGLRLSKIHLSSALRLRPEPAGLERLRAFSEETYLHQVVMRRPDGLKRFEDLNPALSFAEQHPTEVGDEWRVHFHIPLHHEPDQGLGSTAEHLTDTLDFLAMHPAQCQHLEIETYTWEAMPKDLRQADVVAQIVQEYRWCLDRMRERGLA